MLQRLALAAGLVTTLAVIAGVAFLVAGGGGKSAPELRPAAIPAQRTSSLEEAVRIAGAERISYRYAYGINDHRGGRIAYPTNPPTNGPHAFAWTQDGSYAGKPAPPTAEVVHAQEHGRVVIQYRRGLPRRRVAQLQALYEESPEHVLLVENATSMPCDVAITAWGQGVLCRTMSDRSFDALRTFRDRFRDRGPETVP